MKKIVICNIPMREMDPAVVIQSNDLSLPVSSDKYHFPICSFLSETMVKDDDYKFILLVKKDSKDFYKTNAEIFVQEIGRANAVDAKVDIKVIETDFEESRDVHESIIRQVVNEIETGAHLMADITFGSKDLPILIFTILRFAEKFLNCEVDNLLYGQGVFENGIIKNSTICDMSPLYTLSSVTETIECSNPERAKQMLNSLLDL